MKIAYISTFFAIALCSCDSGESVLGSTWFWVVLAIVIVLAIFGSKFEKEDKKKQEEEKERRSKFMREQSSKYNVTACSIGLDYRYAFIIDEKAEEIIYFKVFESPTVIPFGDVRGVELVEDAEVSYAQDLSDVVGRGVVGSWAWGDKGAIIGGLSAETRQKKKLSSIDVRVKLSNFALPVLEINCFDSREMLGKNSIDTREYKNIYEHCLSDARDVAELTMIVIDKTRQKNG